MENYTVTARAPGKIILSGEHAAVYGKPAIALAVNHYAITTITSQPGYGIWFEFLNDRLKCIVSLQELRNLKTRISKRYRKFTVGKCQIKEVVTNPLELIQYAFIYLVENLFLNVKGGVKISVELTLPMGCGMGASAAVILSLMHVVVNYYDHPLTLDKYLYFGREIENLQHGYSSGLDLFLSLNGGCYFLVAGSASKRHLPTIPFILVNTGRADPSTGECVEEVAKYLQDNAIANEFAQITIAMDLALQQNNLAIVKQCVQRNHELLQSIKVVPQKVADFIADVTKRGNAAKISGAGAVYGDNAGVVLIVGEENITDIVKAYGYTVLPIQGELNGLKLI